jgi:hypothetical protein
MIQERPNRLKNGRHAERILIEDSTMTVKFTVAITNIKNNGDFSNLFKSRNKLEEIDWEELDRYEVSDKKVKQIS